MLVLTRKTGEAMMVGNVEVVVVEIRRDCVRLGITAPAAIRVLRNELLYDGDPMSRHAPSQPDDSP